MYVYFTCGQSSINKKTNAIFPDPDTYELISLNGKTVLLYQKYTYSKQGPKDPRYYYCSRKQSQKCQAKINLHRDGSFAMTNTEHNHPPPKLYKTNDGKYLKI